MFSALTRFLEDAARLLFELASSDRLNILSEIQKAPLKLSRVAQKQSATVQETFRQLQRLADARLIEKNSDGAYELTSLGRTVLSLVPSFGFLAKESEFVLSHDLARLPGGFRERIGELLGGERLDQLDDLLAMEERIIGESKEFVWFMSDQLFGHPSHQAHLNKLQKVSMRLLLPDHLSSNDLQSSLRGLGVDLEVRFLDRVDVVLVLNERTSGVAFSSLDGRLDYGRGFSGDAPQFHDWCLDLYSHYWSGARKIARSPK